MLQLSTIGGRRRRVRKSGKQQTEQANEGTKVILLIGFFGDKHNNECLRITPFLYVYIHIYEIDGHTNLFVSLVGCDTSNI